MSFLFGSDPPPAPDYTGAANATGEANVQLNNSQTWANRPTINTPWGQQTWQVQSSIDPTTGKPVNSWAQNISLSPDQQSALNSQMRIQDLRSRGAEQMMGNVFSGMGMNVPASTAGNGGWGPAPPPGTPAPVHSTGGGAHGGGTGTGTGKPGVDTPGTGHYNPFTGGRDPTGGEYTRMQARPGSANNSPGGTTGGIDYSGISPGSENVSPRDIPMSTPTPGALQGSLQAYNLQRGIADPTSSIQSSIQRPTTGTQSTVNGVGNIQRNMDQTAGDWRQTAQDAVSKLQQPGLQEQRSALDTQLANQGITRGSDAYNTAMRQQGDTESRANLMAIAAGRDEAGQLFNQDLQGSQFHNQAQGQQYQQGMGNAQLANSVNQQQFGQNQAQGQFRNAANQQEFGQNATEGTFNNQAQNDMFQQGQQRGLFQNQAQSQDFSQMMQRAQMGDQRAQQELNMAIQAGGFNNQNRQQQISEMLQRRSQPLNELNALMTGQQVGMPQMPSFNTASRAAAPDLMGAMGQTYNANMNSYNSNQANQAGMMNGLFNLGSAAFGFSDRRLKRDIVKVGTLANGINIYKYRMVGASIPELGVLAQEVQNVMPEAVRADSNGFLKVNYEMVLA